MEPDPIAIVQSNDLQRKEEIFKTNLKRFMGLEIMQEAKS
jgi:hypothetical protein